MSLRNFAGHRIKLRVRRCGWQWHATRETLAKPREPCVRSGRARCARVSEHGAVQSGRAAWCTCNSILKFSMRAVAPLLGPTGGPGTMPVVAVCHGVRRVLGPWRGHSGSVRNTTRPTNASMLLRNVAGAMLYGDVEEAARRSAEWGNAVVDETEGRAQARSRAELGFAPGLAQALAQGFFARSALGRTAKDDDSGEPARAL